MDYAQGGERKVRRLLQALCTGLAIATGVTAAASAEFRQLGPHIHGVSTLDIAAEGQTITMELQSPGADIVGFESRPSDDAQKAAVADATRTLAQPLDLFAFPAGAQCTVVSADAEEVFLQEDTGTVPPPPDATPFQRYLQQAQHSVFTAAYTLRCARPEAISAMDFRFFAVFPAAQIVRVQLISKRGQFAFDVARGQPHLAIAGAL